MIISTKNTILRPIKKYNIFYEFLSINFNKNTGIFKYFIIIEKVWAIYFIVNIATKLYHTKKNGIRKCGDI